MFDNDHFTDVEFVVPIANGESESKQVISAHKLVLWAGHDRQPRECVAPVLIISYCVSACNTVFSRHM